MGYIQDRIGDEKNHAKGMKQRKCLCHRLWLWPNERKGHLFKKLPSKENPGE